MKRSIATVMTLLIMFAATAPAQAADDTDALIALDKKWGEASIKADASAAGKFLADKVVTVSGDGIRGKQAELAAMEPAPAATRYEPGDYKVTFINPDTAIMTHSTKGLRAHYSLHVWSRVGGTWQVIASSTTEAEGRK